jgi:hypothetical protein
MGSRAPRSIRDSDFLSGIASAGSPPGTRLLNQYFNVAHVLTRDEPNLLNQSELRARFATKRVSPLAGRDT